MPNRLADLFEQKVTSGDNLPSSDTQSLSDMTASLGASSGALKAQIDLAARVRPRVDYSDFKNFVFFNSALDYFNAAGERLLNDFPYDGMLDDQLAFASQSDGYESYLQGAWPSTLGSLALNGANQWVSVGDPFSGNSSNSLYPGTGSFTIEVWATVPAATSSQVLVSRGSGTKLEFSGSAIRAVLSASDGSSVFSCAYSASSIGQTQYIAFTFDRASKSGTIYTGSFFSLPASAATGTASFTGSVLPVGNLNTLYVGAQTASAGLYSGTLDELRIWNIARSRDDLAMHFTNRIWAQEGLIGYWRFNEQTGSNVVRDYSGNRRDGVISGMAPGCRLTSSLLPGDVPELVLDPTSSVVISFVANNQAVASSYDRNNPGTITNMVPAQYLLLEDDINTSVLRDLLNLFGRQFDELKVAIDHIPHVIQGGYTGFDDAPDALLADTMRFWGWDTRASFLSKEAFEYFFGGGVLTGSAASYEGQRLDTQLYQIKNEFWRRTLNNLPYIYKRKGTREAAEALLRVYGLDEKSVKLKEFGLKPDVGIRTYRINSEKSAWMLQVATTMSAVSSLSSFNLSSSNSFEFDMRFLAADTTGSASTASFPTVMLSQSSGGRLKRVDISRAANSATGTVILTMQSGAFSSSISATNLPVFDGQVFHVGVTETTQSVRLEVRRLDEDDEDVVSVVTGAFTGSGALTSSVKAYVVAGAQPYWVRDVRVWNVELSSSELSDHALNPFSFGTYVPERQALALRWECDKDSDLALASGSLYDASGNGRTGGSANDQYLRFLLDYNFIAPVEYGWNEEKVRIVDGAVVPVGETWNDSAALALEFNLIDALNEDISLMMSSMDNWNNVIGDAANRHRESYPALDRLRRQYFSRLSGRINFRAFADFLDFFDRSFVELVGRLLPARADFKGAEFVVESHMLERPKVQYTYRRHDLLLVPEGVITIYQP